MKNPQTLLSALIAIVCCAIYSHINAENTQFRAEDSNWEYINPAGNRFPIISSYPCPFGTKVTAEDFARMEQCGFNLVRLRSQYGDPRQLAEIAKGTRLRFDVHIPDADLRNPEACVRFINSCKDVDKVALFDFGDELPMDVMRKYILPSYDAAREAGMSQMPIFNRAVVSTKVVDGRTYGMIQELDELEEMFAPAIWSYDYYPVFQKVTYGEDGKTIMMEEAPYANLSMYWWLQDFHDISEKTGRPFWYSVQSMVFETIEKDSEGNPTNVALRRPVTEEFMKFSAFSALAYGAKGLRFWTYSQLPPKETERYLKAPIDLENQKTDLWYATKRVISEVRRFDSLFLNSRVEHVYHSGNRDIKGATRQPDCVGPFRSLTSGEKGILTSLMTYDGKYYMMIVNHDILNSQNVQATASKGIKVRDLTAGAKKFASKSSYAFTLKPGGYVLLEYNRNDAAFRP